MPSSSFPLLRLPLLALVEIIEKIEPFEQFKLSLCSKQMRFVVKNYRGKSTLSLELCGFKDCAGICLYSQKYSGYKITFRVGAEGNIYCWRTYNIEERQSRLRDVQLLFSCENTIKGTKFLVKPLCSLFAAKVEKVVVLNDKIWMFDFAEERQGAFSYDAEVYDNCEGARTDEQLRHILLDLNPRSLAFRQTTSYKFRLNNFHKKYENLTICGGTWTTVENLCQLDCVEIGIHLRCFSSDGINRYLKHVLSGGAPRLRKFKAPVCPAIEIVILDGIQELLMGMEQTYENRNWIVKGTVAREEGWVEVSIKHLYPYYVYLEIKET